MLNAGAAIVITIAIIGIVSIVLTVPFWLLWNHLMPLYFGLPEMSMLDSFFMMIFSNMLFKSTIYNNR